MSDRALYGKSAAGSSNPPIIQIPSGVTTVPKFCLRASTGLNLIGILAPDSSVVNWSKARHWLPSERLRKIGNSDPSSIFQTFSYNNRNYTLSLPL